MFHPKNQQQHQTPGPCKTAIWKSSFCWIQKKSGRRRRTGEVDSPEKSKNGSSPKEIMVARRQIRLRLKHENDGFLIRSALPVETVPYITTGINVAATQKRKSESSAANAFYSDPDHEKPTHSKNISSHKNKKICIQSTVGIPRPKIGTTLMINMILY